MNGIKGKEQSVKGAAARLPIGFIEGIGMGSAVWPLNCFVAICSYSTGDPE